MSQNVRLQEKIIPLMFQNHQFSVLPIDIHNNFNNLNQFT